MSPEMIDLGRRAVACRKWRWMPGCKWLNDPDKPIRNDGEEGRYEEWQTPPRYGIPDLSDAATLGCVLALVREAWGSPDMQVRRVGQRPLWEVVRWSNVDHRYTVEADGATEAEALVAALEAA